MPLYSQRQFRGCDSTAVVDDLDQLDATASDGHPDAGCAGIEGIFYQLLDDGNRPLDNLPGGDLADGAFVEQAKCHVTFTDSHYMRSGIESSVPRAPLASFRSGQSPPVGGNMRVAGDPEAPRVFLTAADTDPAGGGDFPSPIAQ